eukprot:PITA_30533
MTQRHSRNNNELAFFTCDEKIKLGYGTQKERLSKDSIKPFDGYSLCLKPLINPLCCQKGHLFCKECILECLLAQNKDIKRKLARYEAHQKQEKEEKEEKMLLKRQQELDGFDQQNNGVVPQYNDKNHIRDKNSFHGANSVKVTSFEAEILRTMKAFLLPLATPEAQAEVEAPSLDTICPKGKEKVKLKSLFLVIFTKDRHDKKSKVLGASSIFPSCKDTLTNMHTLMAISTCRHIYCKKCVEKFVRLDGVCFVCNRSCKEKHLITLEKGGIGFFGHGDNLEATDFKHVGSGSGMQLMRPIDKI